VWFEHPSTTTICGCGDSSLFSWFLNWPAYAIRHGLNPPWSPITLVAAQSAGFRLPKWLTVGPQ
jgi:hypothetical protein